MVRKTGKIRAEFCSATVGRLCEEYLKRSPPLPIDFLVSAGSLGNWSGTASVELLLRPLITFLQTQHAVCQRLLPLGC